nr:hypothetical protein [Tanacetum cinerariifolium]
IYDHVIEIPLQRIEDIETGQRELEARSLIAGGERASLLEQVTSLERSNEIGDIHREAFRSPAVNVISSIHATRALGHSCVDLIPSRKRFKDSISLEDSVEEDIDTDVLEDIEADATTVEDEVEDEVESSDRGTMEVELDAVAGIDIYDGMLMPDAVERLEQVEEGLQDIYDHVIE